MSTEINEDTIQLAKDTLFGDLRDNILSRYKAFRKPWPVLSEEEQRGEIEIVENFCRVLIEKAVNMIASEGRKVVVGVLQKVSVKDKIQATIDLPLTDPLRHEVMDACGQPVLIVVSGVQEFIGEEAPAEPDPDQPSFINDEEETISPFRARNKKSGGRKK